MKTFVATTNGGKLAEMRAIFAGSALELDTTPLYREVVEDADDYLGNARLKARTLAARLTHVGIRAAVLSDDSGLEVDALDGHPGVRSARYGGTGITWAQRRDLLLAELTDVPDARRGGRFVCAMTLVCADGLELHAMGTVRGRIIRALRGRSGFGYDPLFVPDDASRTYAEFTEEEKNAVSHRRRAADDLLVQLAAARA